MSGNEAASVMIVGSRSLAVRQMISFPQTRNLSTRIKSHNSKSTTRFIQYLYWESHAKIVALFLSPNATAAELIYKIFEVAVKMQFRQPPPTQDAYQERFRSEVEKEAAG